MEYEIITCKVVVPAYASPVKEKSTNLIQIGTTWIGTLGYLGVVHKLDKQAGKKNNFVPRSSACAVFLRPSMGAPLVLRRQGAVCRKDILKTAGIALQDLSTWDGQDRLLKDIQAYGNSAAWVSRARRTGHTPGYRSWVWANGGDFLSQNSKHAALTQLRQAGDEILCRDDQRRKPNIQDSLNKARRNSQNFFMHRAYAFMFSSSWPLQVYLKTTN